MRVPGFKPSREDREDFFRGLIARRFLPWHLAEFFLFDGERVQKLARRDMAKQVKSGIEGILGVQVLRDLQQDLRQYVSTRRSGVERIGDTTLSRVQVQIEEIEARLEPLVKERETLESQLKIAREKRDALMKSLRTMTGGGMESVRELHEKQAAVQSEEDPRRGKAGPDSSHRPRHRHGRSKASVSRSRRHPR